MRKRRRRQLIINPNLIDELDYYITYIKVESAKKVREDLTATTHDVLLAFYSDYPDPVSYRRTPDHKNILRGSFMKFYANPHNVIIRGGVELSPDKMNDLYRVNKEYVFNEVYLGMHGNVPMLPQYNPATWITPSMMNPNPLERILDRRDWIVSHIVSFTNSAVNVAKNGSYQYFHFK